MFFYSFAITNEKNSDDGDGGSANFMDAFYCYSLSMDANNFWFVDHISLAVEIITHLTLNGEQDDKNPLWRKATSETKPQHGFV